MAGDVGLGGNEGEAIPDALIEDPFERLAALLSAHGGALTNIYEELAGVGLQIVGPFLSAAGLVAQSIQQSQHAKLRVRWLIITSDVAATITLTIGAATYPFVIDPDGGPAIIPFPLVIERAGDVTFVASVAATMACYIVGRPE